MNARSQRVLRFESLENRAMMAADLINGVLIVAGTKKADTIQLDVPTVGLHTGELEVNVNGELSYFTLASVNSIRISALGGNDQVFIDDDIVIDAWISGGSGHDELKGGGGADSIYGENGNDQIQGSLGDDELFGDNGKDSLDGGDGSDFLDGGNGKDTCSGGLGDDRIKGGTGKDVLNGDAGNNLLDGDQGKNQLLNGIQADLDNELKAVLAGVGNLRGKAEYESENEGGEVETTFKLEVRNLTANTTFDVTIDGLIVCQIVTDNSGEGELEFSSAPSGGEVAFPVNFPGLEAGSTISVGNVLQGTFVIAHGRNN